MIGLAIGLILLAFALVFTSFLLAVFAALAMVLGAWFWWRTRHLRRRTREAKGVTIEGEYREERDVRRLDEPREPSPARRDPGETRAP